MEKEKESSRLSWPWKKKSSNKAAAAAVTTSLASAGGVGGASPNLASLFQDNNQQETSVKKLQNHTRAAAADEATRLRQSEEKVKYISEQLANALADITAKDNLVKQHAKVAEEAVSGWEKAELEAMALKQQLDTALHQKLAMEDRAAHLDGALKECMKQLRHAREEHEQLMHDTLVKKTREYDKLRVEMETKLAEASHLLSQTRTELLESRAEGKALSHALQERSRSLAELGEAKGRAEADIKVLQVRLEAMEKENANLKYEAHALNKELAIRNEEREYERKAAEIASKQHLDSVKKIAKLEEECNRLRVLMSKKLPGPAALQRMRHEVERLGNNVDHSVENRRRRSLGRAASHLDPGAVVGMTMMQENNAQAIMGYNGVSGIAERMAAMDEEMKILKQALACRNQELQNAQIRCAQTANRLSVVEEELDRALGGGGVQKKQLQAATQQDTAAKGHLIKGSHCSVDKSNGEDVASDTWASALVAELGQFKKEKKSKVHNTSNGNNDKGSPAAASLSLELMDDFVEMERLTKMSEPGRSENMTYSDTASFDGPPQESPMITATSDYQIQELEGALASTRQELDLANTTICDLNVKLATTEEQLTALQTRNSANEDLLIKLQTQLNRLNEIQLGMEKAADNQSPVVFPDQKSRFSIKDILTKRKESGLAAGSRSKTSESSEECNDDTAEEHATVSDAESKASTVHSELAASISRIVQIIEVLAQATGSAQHTLLVSTQIDGMGEIRRADLHEDSKSPIAKSMQWKDVELENAMQSLVMAGNKLLQGKSNMVDFLSELGSILDRVTFLLKPATKIANRQYTEFGNSELTKDSGAARMNSSGLKYPELPNGEIEARGERSHLKEEDLPRTLNQSMGAAAAGVEHLQTEKPNSEDHLTSDDGWKQDELLEEELMVRSSTNPGLVSSSLHMVASGEMNHLHDKVAALEVQLQDERQQHQVVIAKLEELQQDQIHSGAGNSDHSVGSHSSAGHGGGSHLMSQDEDTKSRKEREDREIATAALAECQRTILALGKQLKITGTILPTAAQKVTETLIHSSTLGTAVSIQKLTENMELLRWQTEAEVLPPCALDIANTHNHSPSALQERSFFPWGIMSPAHHAGGNQLSPIEQIPGRQQNGQHSSTSDDQSFNSQRYHGENGVTHKFSNDYLDGVGGTMMLPPLSPGRSDFTGRGSMSVPASPMSVPASPKSVPASPARSPASSVPRSMRTRGNNNGSKAFNEDSVGDETPPQKPPRSSSMFSRFYSKSPTRSSGSSS
ncbi:hypothetical protein BDL97_06G123100 [Sphagnum fallax]|nr:hypothetical protein BDL97_06G123100 [Sphagnum fallax]KAH8960254.1 hypothetical protein BDL97_06G123100 [Sphagnum fallax]